MAHLPFSKSIGREWLLSQVLDGHGYYEVIAASIGYVTRLGDSREAGRKTGEDTCLPTQADLLQSL